MLRRSFSSSLRWSSRSGLAVASQQPAVRRPFEQSHIVGIALTDPDRIPSRVRSSWSRYSVIAGNRGRRGSSASERRMISAHPGRPARPGDKAIASGYALADWTLHGTNGCGPINRPAAAIASRRARWSDSAPVRWRCSYFHARLLLQKRQILLAFTGRSSYDEIPR